MHHKLYFSTMKKILLLLLAFVGALLPAGAATVTDNLTCTILNNETFADITYKSPVSGVTYLSSLYTLAPEIVFQNDGSMKAAIAASSEDLTLGRVTWEWCASPMDPQSRNVVVVYGKDEPYASSHDVYDPAKRGTEIGRAPYPATEIAVEPGYAHVAVMVETSSFGEFTALAFDWKSKTIADNLTCAILSNETFADITYNSPASGVTYLSSLYTLAPEIVFQNDGSMKAAIAASSADLTLDCVTWQWCASPMDPQSRNVVVIYGKDEPYASSHDVYDPAKRGTEIGRAPYPATSVNVAAGYRHVAMMVETSSFGEFTALAFEWAGEPKKTIEPLAVVTAAGDVLSDLSRFDYFAPTTVKVSTATPGITLAWTLGDRSGSAEGSVDIPLEGDGTLTVVASAEGYNDLVYTCAFTYYPPVASIKDFWLRKTLADMGVDRPFTVDFDATVVYVANVPATGSDVVNGQVYITDGTNFSRIFFAGREVTMRPGDVIAKGWTATYGHVGGWKQFIPDGVIVVASHDGEVPAPVAIGSDEALQALDPGTPVVVKGVILARATSSEVYTGDEPARQIQTLNSPVALINAFGIASVDSARYDVYGLVDFYGYKRNNAPAIGPTDGDYNRSQWRVAVTEFELWKPTSPRPQFALANDSEVDSGEPIVITCQDEAATIMYSMDGENYSEYDAANPPVMPAEDVTVSAYSRQEGYHDSAVRRVSLRYSGKAGIADITLDPAGAAEYYDLTGRRVDSPRAGGMYIRVQSGRATKVIL